MNDLTGKDLTDVIFPIEESEIQVLLEATYKGTDYYIQKFQLLDDNEKVLYAMPQTTKFILKDYGNPPIVVNVVTPWEGGLVDQRPNSQLNLLIIVLNSHFKITTIIILKKQTILT